MENKVLKWIMGKISHKTSLSNLSHDIERKSNNLLSLIERIQELDEMDYDESSKDNHEISYRIDHAHKPVIKNKNIGWGGILMHASSPIIDNSRVSGGGCLESAKNALIRDSDVSGGGVLYTASNPILIRSTASGGGVLSHAKNPILYNSLIDGGGALSCAEYPLIIKDFNDKMIINGITFVEKQKALVGHPYRGEYCMEENPPVFNGYYVSIPSLPKFDTSGNHKRVKASFYRGLYSIIEQVKERYGQNIEKTLMLLEEIKK